MASAHPNYQSVVDNIKQHSIELGRTSAAMDLQAFDKSLHDDWFMIDANGKMLTKKQELELLKTSNFKPSSLDVGDLHVEVHGDTAIVTGVSSVKATYEGKDISGRYRFTQVYKSGGGKQLMDHAVAQIPSDFAMVTCITFKIA